MDASQRGEILRKFSDLVERDWDYLAELESYNNGMVISLAKSLRVAVSSIRYAAACADKIKGDTLAAGKKKFTRK